MSDSMRLLLAQLFDELVFYETCSDETLPPHVASQRQGAIFATLRKLPPAEIRAFLQVAEEKRGRMEPEMAAAVGGLFDPLNFDEELAAA